MNIRNIAQALIAITGIVFIVGVIVCLATFSLRINNLEAANARSAVQYIQVIPAPTATATPAATLNKITPIAPAKK